MATVCSGSGYPAVHRQYVEAGMVDRAADFAASRLQDRLTDGRWPVSPDQAAGPGVGQFAFGDDGLT